MTMTVDPTTDVALVPMTAPEARACVDRIKGSMEDIRAQLWELKERQGWKALGYQSWQDCIRDEFAMSRMHAHRLVNAYTVDRILAGNADVTNGYTEPPIPEAHARELAPLLNEPEAVRSVVAKVREEKGDQATADDVRAEVDEHLARPPRAKAAKPAAPVRRSVSSRAEASDYADDAPAYEDQSQETYGGAPNAEQWCPQCGGKYRGERCPCATAPAPMEGGASEPDDYPTVSEQPCTACGGEIVVLSEQDDRARGQSINAAITEGRPVVQLCASCQIGSDAPTPDQPGEAGPSAEADTPTDTTPAPPATAPIQSDGAATRKYALGCDSFLTLISLLDPATVVAGLTPEQWQGARDRHATIRKWLADLDYQLFVAEQRVKVAG